MENENIGKGTIRDYHKMIDQMGKKEFTFLKMQEYGFWPVNLPTPYERQADETEEDYHKRKKLLEEYEKIAAQIAELYQEKDEIKEKLQQLRKQWFQTWDYEKIRKDVSKQIRQESIRKREERKKQKIIEQRKKAEEWNKTKAENIVFIGKGYSNLLFDKTNDKQKLEALHLPLIENDKELATVLKIEYKELRFLTYHRDVMTEDHYYHYTIPKRSGGERKIAAPKPLLKKVQREILKSILEKVEVSNQAHGFYKGRSVISGAKGHKGAPHLLINMDLENFFSTISFERVRGLFHSFGYSGYISSLLAMLCTYCERMPMEIKGQMKYVKTSNRILPQGSPASPMITNLICRKLDEKIEVLAEKYNFDYTRYADDMSFSFSDKVEKKQLKKIMFLIQHQINYHGFQVNEKKTHYLGQNNRQCITGIVVNQEQIGVPRQWVRKLRAAIYHANQQKIKNTLSAETIDEISGMISWLKTVNQDRYQKIIEDGKKIIKN